MHPSLTNGTVYRLFRNREELEKLSELGVLFLLFEMGLELSLDRLKVQEILCLEVSFCRQGLDHLARSHLAVNPSCLTCRHSQSTPLDWGL